jgi:hypothetical protein
MPEPKVSIIILNWNGLQDTLECLESLEKITYNNFEIIVVDNGSTQGEVGEIQRKFPQVRIIRNTKNEGFCRGNNIGAKLALENNPDYLLFLNNDTIVKENFLEELIHFMEVNPEVGIAGPLILYYQEPEYVYSCGGKFNSWFCLSKDYHFVNKKPQKNLNFISGCAFLIKSSLIKQIGLWDEDFFTYWDETDYCLRAKRAGFDVACVPSSVICHKVARTNIYLSKKYIYFMVRNNLLLAKKHAKWYQWPLILTNFLVRRWLGYFFKLLFTRNFSAIPAIFLGTVDFIIGKYGRRRF